MTIALEVPSGVIADRWSRRKMLILSGIFFSACYSLWVFSNSFWLFLLGFFFRTLGGTFASGTKQAYIYDFLKQRGAEERFEKIWGRGNALRTLGIGLAVGFGGFLSEVSFSLTAFLSAVSVFTTSVIAFIWPEVRATESTEEVKYWQFIKDSVKTVTNNKVLLKLMLYTAIVLAWFANLEEFNDVYLNFLGYPRSMIGLIFAVAAGTQSLVSSLAYRFKDNSWMMIKLSVVVGSAVLIAAAFIRHRIMAGGVLLLGVIYEFISVLKEGIIQKETQSYQRATVSSLSEFIMNLLPYQIVFGFIANHHGLQFGYGVFGVFILNYFVLSLFIGKKETNYAKR